MPLESTSAIVLKNFPYGETSKIARFYTRDFGKLSIIGKGIMSSKVFQSSYFEPINCINLNFYYNPKRQLQIFSKAEFNSPLISIKKDMKNSVILNYDSNLNDLGYWYQQLVAESLGKKDQGINPTLSFGPKDHHSLLQLYLDGPRDKFFTFFNFSERKLKYKISKNIIPNQIKFSKNKNLELVIMAQCEATKNIFKLKKIPFRQINFRKKNEKTLGEFFTFFVLETILLSRLINVNPFNQPAVEQIKRETKKILS